MMVPAVTEVCLPQPAHSQVHGLVCNAHALLLPQAGQTKPSGQRAATRYLTHAASSGKRCWNSIKERGKSIICATGGPLCSLFVLTQTRPDRYRILWPRTQRDMPLSYILRYG